jgi:hypothetical protein
VGLVDELQGVRVCMDTGPIIYFIEKNPQILGGTETRIPFLQLYSSEHFRNRLVILSLKRVKLIHTA